MESGVSTLKICSHNINGFDSSSDYIREECDNESFSILALQEHWLRPSYRKQKGVNRLKLVHPKFDAFGTSGMLNQIDKKILKGRPYGGTGFLFRKDLSNSLRARVDLQNNRVTVLELNTSHEKILLINAYMPYFCNNNNFDQLAEYRETLGFIEDLMKSSPNHKFILLMDLNCNIFGPRNAYTNLIHEMMTEFNLVSSFNFSPDFDPSRDYTRFDVKRNSYTLIDGILISESLSDKIQSCSIIHPHDNVSDHLPIELTINVDICDFLHEPSSTSYYIPWSSLSENEINIYQSTMLDALSQISIPSFALNHGHSLCDDCDCTIALETFYKDIISAVEVADRVLPRKKHGISKPFWSPELSALKQKSLDAHNLWKSCNCPRNGPIFNEKKRSNYEYKSMLRKSKLESNRAMSVELSNDLLSKDSNSFWKKWNQINGAQEPPSSMIDGCIKYGDIANCFSDTYSSVYKNSSANNLLRERFNREYRVYFNNHVTDSLTPHLFSWYDMTEAVFSLKIGKSASTFVKAEHIFLGCPELLCYLHLLFNALISHSYLPYDFLCGTISPIVKDSNGNTTDSSNYRPITLGPTFSQLFEHLLFNKFGHFLESSNLQFGFKKGHSASHAVFTLKSCVEYYTKHNSNVLVAFLDCSKAFDTVSHYGIFIKLMERGVPLCFLRIVIYLYLNMRSRCQWRGAYSEYFDVLTGTKQGGIISPRIFSLYMDELIERLKKRGIGCHTIELFVACLLYADDLCLIAPTRSAMQEMLNICQQYCSEYCLTFNVKKSKVLLFGKADRENISDLFLDSKSLEFVKEWKYLGVTVVAGSNLSFSARPALSSFYRAVNSIFSVMRKPDELVLMNLLYSNCVPILSYGAETVEFSSKDLRDCNTAINDAIRKIYSYNRWESTRLLRQSLGFPSIYEIFCRRSKAFLNNNLRSRNEVLSLSTAQFLSDQLGND